MHTPTGAGTDWNVSNWKYREKIEDDELHKYHLNPCYQYMAMDPCSIAPCYANYLIRQWKISDMYFVLKLATDDGMKACSNGAESSPYADISTSLVLVN